MLSSVMKWRVEDKDNTLTSFPGFVVKVKTIRLFCEEKYYITTSLFIFKRLDLFYQKPRKLLVIITRKQKQ